MLKLSAGDVKVCVVTHANTGSPANASLLMLPNFD